MPDTDHIVPPVDTSYRHYPKSCRAGSLVETAAGGRLKWFEIFREDEPIDPAIATQARDAAAALPGVASNDLGFVILHRCGNAFHFLLVQVWRGSNELWETVLYRDGATAMFVPFADAYPATPGHPRPTFCVWEFGAVAAEMTAWTAYLTSDRTTADAAIYLATQYEGGV